MSKGAPAQPLNLVQRAGCELLTHSNMRDKKHPLRLKHQHKCRKEKKEETAEKAARKSEKNAAIGSDDISGRYFAVNFKNQTKQFI